MGRALLSREVSDIQTQVTETIGVKRPRARRLSRLRLVVIAMIVVSALVSIAFALLGYGALANALARAVFPFAQNQFSEAPLILELHRMATGEAAYQPTLDTNSFPYGPAYLFVLNLMRAGQPPNIVSARLVTITLGVLTIVPIVVAGLLIARRAGVPRRNTVANGIAGAAAGLLGAAAIMRAITFDTVHPDGLLFFLVGSSLALYYAIASRALRPQFVWLVAALGVFATFTELRAFAIVPALLLALAAARVISYRLAFLAIGANALVSLVVLASMPGAERAWTFLVPIGQPLEITPARVGDLVRLLVRWQPYIGLSILTVPATLAILWRRERERIIWIDAVPVAIVLATAIGGFLQKLGLWNNLSLICVACAPYFGAMLGALVTPRVLASLNRWLAAGCVVLAAAMCIGLNRPLKQEPSVQISSEMDVANNAAGQLCSSNKPIVVMAMPDFFFTCPTAKYALAASFQQLAAAYPEYYVGPTAFEKAQTATYVVTVNSLPLPARWAKDYTLDHQVPAVAGFDQYYFPLQVQFFKHR